METPVQSGTREILRLMAAGKSGIAQGREDSEDALKAIDAIRLAEQDASSVCAFLAQPESASQSATLRSGFARAMFFLIFLASLLAASRPVSAQRPAAVAPTTPPLASTTADRGVARAQQTFSERFFAHNYAMTALQPSWPTPLVESEPRLTQYYRLAFSNQYTPGRVQTVNYGNGRGGGIVAWNRVEIDWLPPSYIQHHSSSLDGFGDTAALVKFRIASGNAEHGNFIATALLNHTFASSPRNGAATDSWNPTLAGGIGFLRHFDAETSLGGALPTGKIASQGRSIAWNALVQDHVSRPFWLEIENNATFYFAGSHDGKMQNFITPAAYYVYKHVGWKPEHPYLVFTGGMQIASSQFHTYNHNLIMEIRVLF